MRFWPAFLVAFALAASWAPGAHGFEENGCERQRADYPLPDRSDAGSFYNKAPRFGVFGDALYCKPVKDGDP